MKINVYIDIDTHTYKYIVDHRSKNQKLNKNEKNKTTSLFLSHPQKNKTEATIYIHRQIKINKKNEIKMLIDMTIDRAFLCKLKITMAC